MAQRTRYLLAYDIRNDGRLRRVHKVAKAWGDPLQYSLFVCDLTKAELLGMREELRNEMNLDIDSIGIFDLGPPTARGIECIEFIGARRPLPGSEPRVW